MAMSSIDGEGNRLGATQTPKENTAYGVVEAVAVQMPDPRPQVVVYQYVPSTNPPVRDNATVQCCYPITVEDPADMIQARKLAILHLCFEIAALPFCGSGWCAIASLITILPSSMVACCCKRRGVYLSWSCVGACTCWLHLIAAVEAVENHHSSNPPAFNFSVQIFLSGIGALAMYYGRKVASSPIEPIHPVEIQAQAPAQASAYPQVGVVP